MASKRPKVIFTKHALTRARERKLIQYMVPGIVLHALKGVPRYDHPIEISFEKCIYVIRETEDRIFVITAYRLADLTTLQDSGTLN